MRQIQIGAAYLAILLAGTSANAKIVQIVARGGHADGIEITWTVSGQKPHTTHTDAQGVASIEVPDGGSSYFDITLKKPGLVPLRSYWSRQHPGDVPPDQMTFNVEPATTISGVVVDDDGKSVAGAHVEVSSRKQFIDPNQRVDLDDAKPTDATGRWSLGGVPVQGAAIEIGLWHRMHLSAEGYYRVAPYEPQANLYDGTAKLTLHNGTRLEGIVRVPNGAPCEGAKVFYNADRHVSNSYPPLTSDAAGKFVLGIVPGGSVTLIAEHRGFAPAIKRLPIGLKPQTIEIVLNPSNILTGHVTDGNGKSIANAEVNVSDWQGRDQLDEQLRTDANGDFTWPDAPADTVKASVSAEGYAHRDGIELKAGAKNEISIVAPTKLQVSVIDAADGQPVQTFAVHKGIVWHDGEQLVWQGDAIDKEVDRSADGFTHTVDQSAIQFVFGVTADGYYAAETPAFAADGQPKQFTLKLQRGEPMRGQIIMADGSPAGEGKAYFNTEFLSVREGNEVNFPELQSQLMPDGHYSFPPQRKRGQLVVVTAKGGGFWKPGEWEQAEALTIQPFGTVHGRIMIGDKPAANSAFGSSEFETQSVQPLTRWSYDINTDSDGRFKLQHVWPGRLKLTQRISNHSPGRMKYVPLGQIDVKPGDNAPIQIGGTGRAAAGRLDLSAFAGKPWMERVDEIRRVNDADAMSYSAKIDDDGHFRVDDLPAGDYKLNVALHEWPPINACGWGRVLGEYKAQFTVPAVPGGEHSVVAVDVGTLAAISAPAETVKVGEVAPDFETKTIDGNAVKLSDFKGKFVLLDFWATWCASCMAELPQMKALRAAHANDARLVILGMNVDKPTDPLAKYFEQMQIDWPQITLGEESPIAARYGATAIPATVLIGPDGKVIARDLRGSDLAKAVDAALNAALAR